MSSYLNALGLYFYLATAKSSDINNGKYIEANAQAMEALKHTLRKDYISMISHCDSTFAVWITLTSLKEQTSNNVKRTH